MSLMRSQSLQRQRGVTLVELMISLALGVVLVLAATDVMLSGRQTYISISASAGIQDSAGYIQSLLRTQINHAGFTSNPVKSLSTEFAADTAASSTSGGIAWSAAQVVSGVRSTTITGSPDTLYVRLQGNSDGSTLDCLGQSVVSGDTVVMKLYMASDLALYCTVSGHDTNTKNQTQPLVQGIEGIRLLFGVDSNEDNAIDKWLQTTQLATASTTDKTHITAVRVGLIISSTVSTDQGSSAKTFSLLGSNVTTAVSSRMRQAFENTFWLPNVALMRES